MHGVVLPQTIDNPCGYINASAINLENLNFTIYATQGPMEETVEDFFLMLWMKNIRLIVMLTDFNEQGVTKCYKYLPQQSIHLKNGLIISMTSNKFLTTNSYSEFTITNTHIKNSVIFLQLLVLII